MKLELKYPFTKRIGNSWLKEIYEPVTCSEHLISYKDPLCELIRLKSNVSIQIGFLYPSSIMGFILLDAYLAKKKTAFRCTTESVFIFKNRNPISPFVYTFETTFENKCTKS